MDVDNHLNGIFLFFNSLNCEFSPGFRLIDDFSSHFSFYQANHKDKESKAIHLCKLKNIFTNILLDPKSIIVVSNISIRNNVAMSILYIYSHFNIIRKTIYHTVNVTTTKAKLFAIRCEINQAIQISETIYIIVITNIIYLVQCIFDSAIHLY